jgi:hypothetical protein
MAVELRWRRWRAGPLIPTCAGSRMVLLTELRSRLSLTSRGAAPIAVCVVVLDAVRVDGDDGFDPGRVEAPAMWASSDESVM